MSQSHEDGRTSAGPTRIAYLVSQYPTISHAFIEREVLALRGLGVDVHTFSVRPSRPDELLSDTARDEARRTVALLGRRPAQYASTLGRAVLRHPRALARQAAVAWSTGPGEPRARVWQLFYLAEAVVLREELLARGLRHVHVHFANNGADIARRVVGLGEAIDGPAAGWRWSFSMHGPTEFTDPRGFDLVDKVRSSSAVACISDYCRDALLADVPESERPRTAIVRMSVDAGRFDARTDDPGPLEGPLRVLFVGRLVPEKGPDVLLRALAGLRDRGVEFEAVVIGRGELRGPLEDLVAELRLGDHVRLAGPVGQDDLPAWYRWADVFCLPSFDEGVPVVLMEAMASEVPVVTTRITGIPELVDERSGILVPPGDPGAVADALVEFAKDPGRRRRAGEAGRRRVVEDFDPVRNAQELITLLSSPVPVGSAPLDGGAR